jgi:predicted dehydrogenase
VGKSGAHPVASVRTGALPGTAGQDALKALEVVKGTDESAESGRTVQL